MKSDTMPCIVVPKAYRAALADRPIPTLNTTPNKPTCQPPKSPAPQNIQQSSSQALPHIEGTPLQPWNVHQLTMMLASLSQEISSIGSKLQDFEARMSSLEAREPESDQPKKKQRRRACEIEKIYKCPHPNCCKRYGSEISLNLHVKLKHRQGEHPNESQERDRKYSNSLAEYSCQSSDAKNQQSSSQLH